MNMQLDRPLLVIGAHPDDIELMAGGLIARMTAGKNEVYSMVISDGGRNGDVQVRYRELKRAARILNIKDVYRGEMTKNRKPMIKGATNTHPHKDLFVIKSSLLLRGLYMPYATPFITL
jgi:hypothetical protein